MSGEIGCGGGVEGKMWLGRGGGEGGNGSTPCRLIGQSGSCGRADGVRSDDPSRWHIGCMMLRSRVQFQWFWCGSSHGPYSTGGSDPERLGVGAGKNGNPFVRARISEPFSVALIG